MFNFWVEDIDLMASNKLIKGKKYSPMHESRDIDTSKKNTPDNSDEYHIDIIIRFVKD